MTTEGAVNLVQQLRELADFLQDHGYIKQSDVAALAVDYIEENEERMDDARDAFRAVIGGNLK